MNREFSFALWWINLNYIFLPVYIRVILLLTFVRLLPLFSGHYRLNYDLYWRQSLITLYYSHYSGKHPCHRWDLPMTVKKIPSLCVASLDIVGTDTDWHLFFIHLALKLFSLAQTDKGPVSCQPWFLSTTWSECFLGLFPSHVDTGHSNKTDYSSSFHKSNTCTHSIFELHLLYPHAWGDTHSASGADGRMTARQNKEKEQGPVHVQLIYCCGRVLITFS